MKPTITFLRILGLAAGVSATIPCLRANSAELSLLNQPASATGGTNLAITVAVSNTGDNTWGGWHNLVLKDAAGVPVAMESIDGVEPGQTVTITLNYGLPNVAASLLFHVQALEHNVEWFGPTLSFSVSVTPMPQYAGVLLSTTTFDAFNPAFISTSEYWLSSMPAYRLRAKVNNNTSWGWHAANLWNQRSYPLDNPPPAGSYYPCSLYYVTYNTLYGSVSSVGPERREQLQVRGSVTLSSHWFHSATPPTISTAEPMNSAYYRLFATFVNFAGQAWETAGGLNNNGARLANLPPPGGYNVALQWKKYDAAMNLAEAGPVRNVTIQVTEGPFPLVNCVGEICGYEVYDEEEGTSHTEYDTAWYELRVPASGQLWVRGAARDRGEIYLNAYRANWEHLQSGIPEIAFVATPGTYYVAVWADRNVIYDLYGELAPHATAPTITSPATATGMAGVGFAGYTAAATGSAPMTFGAPDPAAPNGLPRGLQINPTTGAITGVPTTPGTYAVWLTASNGAGSVGRWVTFTIGGLAAPVAFAAKEVEPTAFLATWSAVPGATQYRLDLAADAAFSRVVLADWPVAYSLNGATHSGLSHWVRNSATTPLTPGNTYYYRVRASAEGKTSGYSNTISVEVPRVATAGSTTAPPVLLDMPLATKLGNDWVSRRDGVLDRVTPLGVAGGTAVWVVDLPPDSGSVAFDGDVNAMFVSHPTLVDGDGNGVPDDAVYAPGVVWQCGSVYTYYLQQKFVVGVEFHAEPGRRYEIYTSPAAVITPENLKLWGSPTVFDSAGPQTFIGAEMLASDFQGLAFYLVEHVFAPAGVQITLPVIGDVILRQGANGSSGAITVLGDLTIEVAAGGGPTVRRNGAPVSLPGGGILDLGGGVVLSAGVGTVVLNAPGGVALSASAGGITLAIPGGATATVAPNGAVALSLPAGAATSVKNAVDQLGSLLGLGSPNGPAAVAQVVSAGGAPNPAGWGTASQILLGNRPAGDYDVHVKEANTADATAIRIRVAILPALGGGMAGPARMWINDDADQGDYGRGDLPLQATPNFSDSVVNGMRDLVDFFPVVLNLRDYVIAFAPGAGARYRLKQADGAVNFVYTNLTATNAQSIHREILASGFGDDFYQPAGSASVRQVTAAGTELSAAFLQRVASGASNVILLEGRAPSSQPLVLALERADGTTVATFEMPLRVSAVESMFRHCDLTRTNTEYSGSFITPSPAAEATRTGDPGAPYPDGATNGKYFVFLHGYNVNGQEARGWHCEIFKRLYQLGSRARFVGVTWHGATGADYHKAVFHAFQTGEVLGAYLQQAGVTDDVTVAAHSLGNMLVSHAIASGGFTPRRYYMVNAAVAIEAYDPESVDSAQILAMTEDDWKARDRRLYAANWHELFVDNPADQRGRLTWKGVFRVVPERAELHNFFTPGEDVVENPSSSSSHIAKSMVLNWSTVRGLWGYQELLKGCNFLSSDGAAAFFSRTQAGWNWDYNTYLFTRPDPNDPADRERLKTKPAFERFAERDLHHQDWTIASAKAGQNKVWYDVLARGVPALSFAAAANRLPMLDRGDLSRNFNMETAGRLENRWPAAGHTKTEDVNRWLHSDLRDVALPYVASTFDAMITKGNLK